MIHMKNKNKKGTKNNPIEITATDSSLSYEVIGANIVDELCNYSMHVAKGNGIGKHTVKGEGIIDEDMRIAFSKFNVHLAIIDGVFRHKSIEIDKLNKFHTHEITTDYTVTGFKLNGEEDNLSIVLIGFKHVATGTMEMETPRVPLDNMGGYEFHKELKAASEVAIQEVELYINGKYTLRNPKPEDNADQLTIGAAIEEAEAQEA